MRAIVCRVFPLALACSGSLAACFAAAVADSPGWIELIGEHGFDGWRKPTGGWLLAGDAAPDPKNRARLVAKPGPGKGTLVNGVTGKTRNLLSKQDFGDLEGHFEFKIPKGSNSGVKFESLYEIQIDDSFGIAKPTASHCGGIYPRAERFPRYHHIDDGTPPRVNAARQPGEWQTLDVVFHAPRFGADGKKVKNARFEKVILNGQVIHENVELKTPTGHAWRLKEVARGPILLQGDHGPVAFRNIRVRTMD
jgi:hypothetical protein